MRSSQMQHGAVVLGMYLENEATGFHSRAGRAVPTGDSDKGEEGFSLRDCRHGQSHP